MSVRLEVSPRITRIYRNVPNTESHYTGFNLTVQVYVVWDNGEYNTIGAELTFQFQNSALRHKYDVCFNKDKKQSGREHIYGITRTCKSAEYEDFYSSDDIAFYVCYKGISDEIIQGIFPAKNFYSGFRSYFDLYGPELDEYRRFRYSLYDDLGCSNRKWKIEDYYGNIWIQGTWPGSDAELSKYYYPTESELDRLYLLSSPSELNPGRLLFEGNIEFTGTYRGEEYTYLLSTVQIETLGKHPTAVIAIKDTDATTKALTGDESKFIRYFSDMNISVAWTVYNDAEIASYSTKCNVNYLFKDKSTMSVKNLIDTKCTFTCSDTKGLTTTITRTPVLIPYTKLTCIFQPTMSLEGDISFTTSGNYFNSNFGVQNNSLTLQYRYKLKDGSYGNWIAITPTIEGNSYSGNVAFKIPDFQYQNVYVFQVKATDKLMEIFTPEYTVNSTPVFDWSKNDFNFNVPVTIKGVPVYVEEVLYNSTGTSDRDSTLISGKFSDYDYVEILYCDNNSRGWGSTKIYKPENDMIIHLSLVESNDNSGGFYFRHTNYKIQNDNEIVKEKSAYNYFNASSSTPYKSYAGNLIKIRRILGYRGITQ